MELSSNRRVRITVRGRVQGVGYRASTVYEASRLRLTGWVRNQPDGSVILEAQGPADRVAQLEGWCRRGPSLAKVTTCDVEELAVVAGEDDFDVRR
jgi:acylphosphatase